MSSKRGFNIHDHEGAADNDAAQTVATDRFARARRIVAAQPSGISTAPASQPGMAMAPAAPSDPGQIVTTTDNVLDNAFNARHSYSEHRVTELSASIAQRGQLSPALACTTARVRELVGAEDSGSAVAKLLQAMLDGSTAQYMMIGGHYRKKAISRLPEPKIELKLVKVATLLDLYSLSYIENDEREDTTPLDDAMSWKNLLDTGIAKNHDEISRATKKPRTTIVKTLAILKLPASVLDILREAPEKYTLTAGYQLSQLSLHLQAPALDELARKIIAEEVSTRELEDKLKAIGAERPSRKPREISRQHKILADGEEVGVIKEWDTGRVTLDVKLPDQADREVLVAELRKRFGLEADPSQLSLKA